jgi:hypothetical protein
MEMRKGVGRDLPIQMLLVFAEPTLMTTHRAHDVRLYTKTKGMYVAHVQHTRSHFRAHRRTTSFDIFPSVKSAVLPLIPDIFRLLHLCLGRGFEV